MAPLSAVLTAYLDQQPDYRGQLEELKMEMDNLKQTLQKTSPREDTPAQTSGEATRDSGLCTRYQQVRSLAGQSFPVSFLSSYELCQSNSLSCCLVPPPPPGPLNHQLLGDISIVLTDPAVPFGLHRQKAPAVGWQETDFQTLVPTLGLWAQQLCLLKDLQRSLNKLSHRLMPWQPPDEDKSAAKVEDMMLLVDTMLENTETDDGKVLRSPTRHTLSSIVSHFQKLFDVKSLQGVYPRMSELYSRLGELTNAMRNLQDVLELDGTVSPAEVVNHVAKLVSSTQQSTEIRSLLGEADLHSVIVKVKQHEEFFPVFHALILDILQTLGVSCLDDILPALRAFKQTP